MANGGLAIVDEFDKLREDDRAKLHEALEQSEIHIDKANIHAVLPARCALLAAANPKMGRFDKYESLAPQINLAPALLSRFDLIFLLLDSPDPKKDEDLSWHILSGASDVEPVLHMDFLRKFLACARQIRTKTSEDANRQIQRYYTTIRGASHNSNSISVLPRVLHSLRRLAEASAKLRLSCEVSKLDVQAAIAIYEAAFRPLISTEAGGLDADIIDLGISQLDRDRAKIMLKIITDLSHNGGATISRIKEEADRASIPSVDALRLVKKLKIMGEIMEIKIGEFVLSGS
jgi:replicative DNA helicase Mcm